MGNNTPSHGRNSHEREAEIDIKSAVWTKSTDFYGPSSSRDRSRSVDHISRPTTHSHKSLPKSSKIRPITSDITYRRNKHGNYQIHCSHHRFPAFIFDTIQKVIIGTQHEDEIYALTNAQKNICDEWGLAYGDITIEPTPPSYTDVVRANNPSLFQNLKPSAPDADTLQSRYGVEPSLPSYANVVSLNQNPNLSAPYTNPFDFTIHAPLFHHEK
jgi:hypothetical protein